jgi:hypothetical protein
MLQKLLVVVFIFVATVIFSSTSFAQSADLTSEKRVIVVQTCVSAQTVMQKIQHNDAATRVNRGQTYATIISRLMTPLNTRSTSNGYNSSATLLTDTTKRYQQALDDFKDHYKNYDNAVSNALKTKCKDKPEVFYGYIEDARRERQNVAADVTALSGLVGEYRVNVLKLRSEVQ